MEEDFSPDKIQTPADKSFAELRKLFQTLRKRAVSATGFIHNSRFVRIMRRTSIVMAAASLITAISAIILYAVPFIVERVPLKHSETVSNGELKKDASYNRQISFLKRDIQRLTGKYNSYTSGQSYIVINTTENTFHLYRNKKLVREGNCSSGSYTLLKTADGDKKWIFKTPKGKYWIQGKTVNPVWHKPDWAFVEEGLPVPARYDHSRFEAGVLGDYAMAIGNGYLIHGTIYQRFIGLPVTHGCVRLNDEDLEVVFNTLNIGSKVYIF
jgi:lipoprotein-anchoring transpeptidase ErfK/SrfK